MTKSECAVTVFDSSIRLSAPDGTSYSRKSVQAVDDKVFTFDQVFTPDSTQEDVYAKVAQHAKAVIRGYNTTVFAYGSTGSGKSYTMTGTSANPGIIPRVVSEIFSIIETTTSVEKDVLFYVRMSYVELYNNNFRNLLEGANKDTNGDTSKVMGTLAKGERSGGMNFGSSSHPHAASHPHAPHTEKIEVRESQAAGVFLSGHNLRQTITSAQEAFVLISKGNKLRATGYTNCNDLSSRSHAILTIHVESRVFGKNNKDKQADGSSVVSGNVGGLNASSSSMSLNSLDLDSEGFETASCHSVGGELRLGKMHLVDLAGSERLAMSGAEGDTLVETQNINLSLTALGDVLSALSKNATILAQQGRAAASGKGRSASISGVTQTQMPVPYRNSKLTHLLKDSLGGNSKTIMITNVRSLAEYYQQTSISLLYASRAKKIQNKISINRNVIGDTGIHAVTGEIERLKKRLDDRTAEFDRLKMLHMRENSENATLKSKLTELNAINDQEKKQLEQQMGQIIHSQLGQLEVQKRKIVSLQDSLQQELAVSQNVIAEQDREIKWLKGALEDTSVEVKNQSTEQLQRMQRVVDAWQTQATNSQQELASANKKIEELRNKVNALSSELGPIKETNHHLREELQERNQENATLIATEARLQKELKLKSNVLATVNAQNTDYVSQIATLTAAGDKSGKSQVAADNRIAALEAELAALRDAYSRHENESRRTTDDLERMRTDIEESLTHRLTQAEEKARLAVTSAAQQLEEVQSRCVTAETKLSASQKEFHRLKEQVVAIQSKTESVIRQKDVVINGLNSTNKTLQQHVSEANGKANALEVSNNSLQSQLNDLKLAHQDHDKELLSKSETFLSQLELRANEVKQIHASYKEALDKQKSHYESTLADVRADHLVQLARASENTKTELSHQLLATEELKLHAALHEQQLTHEQELKSAQMALKEAHSQQLAQELARQKTQLEELFRHRAETEVKSTAKELQGQLEKEKTQFATEIEVLKQSHQRAVSELQSVHKDALAVQKAELVARHQEEIQTLHSELERKKEEHSEQLDRTSSDSQAQLKTTVANYKSKYEKVYKAKLAEVEGKHKESYAQLQEALEETQQRLQAELTLSLASQERRLQEQYAREMDTLRQEGHWHEEQAQQRLQALETEYEQRLVAKEQSVRDTVQQEGEAKTAAAVQKLQKEHRAALETLQLQLQAGSQDQLSEAIAAQARKHAAELQEVRDAAAAEALLSVNTLEKQQRDHEANLITHAQASVAKAKEEWKSQHQQAVDALTAQLAHEWTMKLESSDAKWRDICNQNVDAKAASLAVKASEDKEAALEGLTHSLTKQFEQELEYSRQQIQALKVAHEQKLCEVHSEHAVKTQQLVDQARHEVNVDKECSFKDQMEKLEGNHSAALKQLNAELKEAHEQQMELEAEKLHSLQAFVVQLKQQHDDTLKELAAEHESRLQQAVRVREVEVKEQAEEVHAKALEQLKKEYDLHCTTLVSTHDAVCSALQMELVSLKSHSGSVEDQVHELRERAAFDLKLMQTKHEQQMQEIIDEKNIQYKTALRSANDVHTMEIQRLMVVQEKAEARHKAHSAQLEHQHATTLNRLEADHKAALLELERSLEARHAHQVSTLTNAHKRSMEEICSDKDSAELKLIRGMEAKTAAVEECQEVIRALQEASTKAKRDHAEELEHQSKQAESRLARSLKDMESRYESQIESLNSSRDKLVKSHEDSVAMLKASAVMEMEANSRRLLHDYQNKSLEEMRGLTERSDARDLQNKDMMARMRAEMEVAEQRYRSKLQAASQELQDAQETHTKALAAAERRHEEVAQQMLDEFEAKLAKALEGQSQQHAAELARAQENLEQVQLAHAGALAELNKVHQEKVSKLTHKASKEVENLKDQLSQLKVSQSEKDVLHATEMEMLAESHEEATDKLHLQYQRNLDHALEAQALKYANEMETSLMQCQDELSEKHSREVERLTTEAKEKTHQMEGKIVELSDLMRQMQEEYRKENELLRADHSAELQRVTQDGEAKVAQWKAMNHQLEQSMNAAGEHHRELQNDIDAAQHQQKQQMQNLVRAHESQTQALQHAHEDALYKLRRDAELMQREWREKEEAQEQRITSTQATLKAKEAEIGTLSNNNLKLTNLVASMKAELETLSSDFDQMQRANTEKEEEFHNSVLPSLLSKERQLAEVPLRQEAAELSRQLQEVTAAAQEEHSRSADEASQLRAEVERAERLVKEAEEQREQAAAQATRATQAALRQQHEDLQSGYLQVIQQQVESLMQVIVTNTDKNRLGNTKKGFANSSLPPKGKNNSGVDEMYERFLEMVQTLPDVWKEKYGSFPSALSPGKSKGEGEGGVMGAFDESTGQPNPAYSTIRWHLDSLQQLRSNLKAGNQTPEKTSRTPIKVLRKAEEEREQWILDQSYNQNQNQSRGMGAQYGRSGSKSTTSSSKENVNLFSNLDSGDAQQQSQSHMGAIFSNDADKPPVGQSLRQQSSQHSVKTMNSSHVVRTSPTDQLISAVLDGDCQGIRAVVKSSGHGSLTSEFWKNITASVLPLHRAISGLHFHGSEQLLVSTLDTLLTLGADIQELDHSGNSAIHKAIQVCTSKSIVNVVKLLVDRGVNVNARNMEGNTAMHCECKR